ncbi:MAG: hypothetical protein HQL55_01655, partial [Magnetococcales bacterium]|nr:hypothetical protein [Magnetococcales bacterium]
MKLGKLIFGVFVLVVGLFSTLVNAGDGERSLATIEESNNTRFETPWTEVKAGQSVSSGVALAKNGTLSVNGKPMQPAIKVTDSAGKAGAPSSVKISASSPSGRFALLIACEPVPSPDNLCWFQYLLDLEKGQVLDAGWAKYPVPSHIWWSKEDTYAILPISDEGETWLTVLDLKKLESSDIHFFESLEKAGRSLPCKPNEEQTVIDLDSL